MATTNWLMTPSYTTTWDSPRGNDTDISIEFSGGRFSTNDQDERARFGSYALYRRASEATTLRAHLNQELDDQGRTEPATLCGDMNDEVDAATTQILNGPDLGIEKGLLTWPLDARNS